MNPKNGRYYTFVKPILKNKYVKNYGPLVFSLITALIFGIFAVKPTLATIVSLQKGITEQNEILDKLNKKTENLSLAKRNYREMDSAVKAKINNLLPDSPSLTCLIDTLTTLANTYDASISGLQIQPTQLNGISKCPSPEEINSKGTNPPTLEKIEFTINTQANFNKLSSILEQISQSPRLISIDSISFNKIDENSLIMSINAKAYYYKY